MTCYLCHAPVTVFLKKNGYTILRCSSCGLARTQLNEDYQQFVRRHYGRGYFTGDPRYSAYVNYKDDKSLISRNMSKLLAKITKYKPKGRLLDIGCALGFFVELALQRGYDAYGLDASNYAVHEARKLVGPARIQEGTIDTVHYKEKSFDVITMLDIFEHLADPRRDLKRVRSWLKDDGILVIATGDTGSVLAKVLARRWTFYIPPQHLFFFNKANLTRLFGEERFTPRIWFRIGKWVSLRYVLHLARTTGESTLAKKIYPLANKTRFGKIPLYLPVRDNMVVIAEKKV